MRTLFQRSIFVTLMLAALAVCSPSMSDREAQRQPTAEFPVVGAIYQLDRAKFPEKVAICATEDAMTRYMEAKNSDAATKQLFPLDSVAAMKEAGGCTLISSYSQAKITKKGIESHQAEFLAFPFEPMWGYYEYFGGRVK